MKLFSLIRCGAVILLLGLGSACTASSQPTATQGPSGLKTETPQRFESATPVQPAPTRTPEPSPKPASTTYPGSIERPHKLGERVLWTTGTGPVMRIEILEAYRGYAARQFVLEAGQPAPTLPEGFEWIYILVSVGYEGTDGGPFQLREGFWRTVSDGEEVAWEEAPVCCLLPAFNFTLQPGETRTGALALPVKVEDPSPLLGVGAGADAEGAIYFEAFPDTLTPTNVLFEDDFSSSTSGWQDIFRDETGISDYDRGGFRIQVLEENFDYWANPGLDFSDVIVAAEARKIGGPDDNVFGLICRYSDPGNFYFFLISSDGFYGIGKYVQGEYALIGSDLMLPTEAIRPGEGVNRMRAECIGERLRWSVNGVQLAEQFDRDHPTGDVGLIAGSFAEPGTDILFDHFAVLAP